MSDLNNILMAVLLTVLKNLMLYQPKRHFDVIGFSFFDMSVLWNMLGTACSTKVGKPSIIGGIALAGYDQGSFQHL